MKRFKPFLDRATRRTGSAQALEAKLPAPRSARALRALADDRYLSQMSLRVFSAGLKHSMVEAKWPAFEEAFLGFDPRRVANMSEAALEALMKDRRLIRHWPKISAVPKNATAMLQVAKESGSFGVWLAGWPESDIVGLWAELSKRFTQLGGSSAPYFLRMVGKDTFMLTPDTTKALVEAGAVARKPSGKKDLEAVQAAFNAWAEETGRPLCQLSRILALSVG
jgi:3-methyladenine DNA glycosylase Tag